MPAIAQQQIKTAVDLYQFQRDWLADKSRLKAGIMSRQVGKSFIVALEAVDSAIETGGDWVLLSAGERQSRELMEKCRMHLEAYSIAASDIEQDYFADTQCRQLTIRLPSGAKIIGLPANPATARGFSGNVILDEFAFHRDSDQIWKALFPVVSRGYKLRVVSTPQGKSNKFYKIVTGDNRFSTHKVDIYRAVADGVPLNIDELRAGIDDEDAWQQEYLIQFMDEATAFLTYDLITACEADKLTGEVDYEDFDPDSLVIPDEGPLYCGVDIGRKKDLTIFYIVQRVGDVDWTRAIIRLAKQKFAVQQKLLWQLIRKFNIDRTCIDGTGIGAQLAEETHEEFGSRAEEVLFTAPVKNDLATRTRRRFEDRLIRIPISQKLRNDLHSIKKTTTAAGNIRFDAERTKDGHADRFWALALAQMATEDGSKTECVLLS